MYAIQQIMEKVKSQGSLMCTFTYACRAYTADMAYTPSNTSMPDKRPTALSILQGLSEESIYFNANNLAIDLIDRNCNTMAFAVDIHTTIGKKTINALDNLKSRHPLIKVILLGHHLESVQNPALRALYLEIAPLLDAFSPALFREIEADNLQQSLEFFFNLSAKTGKKLFFQVDQANDFREEETIAVLDFMDTAGKDFDGKVHFIYGTSIGAYSEQKRFDVYQRMVDHKTGLIVCPKAQITTKWKEWKDIDYMAWREKFGEEIMPPINMRNSLPNIMEMYNHGVLVTPTGLANVTDTFCPHTAASLKKGFVTVLENCRIGDSKEEIEAMVKMIVDYPKQIFGLS